MSFPVQPLSLILPLILLGLIIPAGLAIIIPFILMQEIKLIQHSIALYRIRSLALPISTVTASATILLPILTAASLQVVRATKRGFSIPVILLFILLAIYQTVIAVLALIHTVPASRLDCGLEEQWNWLFSNKNANVIRNIQDRHGCCGLRSVQDRAWPFPDRTHTAMACAEAFGRVRSCFGGWRQDEQIASGLILLVAIVTFLIKLVVLFTYRGPNSYFQQRQNVPSFTTEGDAPQSRGQRRIEDRYRDDPLENTQNQESLPQDGTEGNEANVVLQPSSLHVSGNEWGQV